MTSETGTAPRTTDDEHDLRRSLGFRDLVVYGLLFVAPMAPVGVFGTLDAGSHGAVALVYIVAGWTAMLDYPLVPACRISASTRSPPARRRSLEGRRRWRGRRRWPCWWGSGVGQVR